MWGPPLARWQRGTQQSAGLPADASLYSTPQQKAETHEQAGKEYGHRAIIRFELIGEVNAGSEPVKDLVGRDESDKSHRERDQDRDQIIYEIHSSSRCTWLNDTARCLEIVVLS